MSPLPLFTLAVVVASLAAYVAHANPRSPVNRWFALHTLTLAAWVCGVAGVQSGGALDAWSRFTFASASLIPWSFLGFSRTFPEPTHWPPRWALASAFFVALAFAVLSLSTPLVVYDVTRTPAGPTRQQGLLYPIFAFYVLVGSVPPLALFVARWRRARGLARAQLQYLGAGLLILAGGAITANLLVPLITGRSSWSWLGPYFILPFVALVGHAIIRHRLLDLRLVVHRSIAYATVMVAVTAAVIVLGRRAVPSWGREPWADERDVVAALVIVLAMLTQPLQRLLSSVIDPYLHRRRIDYSAALRHATQRLSYLMEPAALADEIRELLTRLFVPESFFMLIRPRATDVVLQLLPVVAPSSSDEFAAIVATLASRPSPSVLVCDGYHLASTDPDVFRILKSHGIQVALVLGRRQHFIGAILLGPRKSGDAYFAKDLDFLSSVAQLASVSLENALLHRHRLEVLEYSQRLLESLDSAVVAVDTSGIITSANAAAARLLGVGPEPRGASLSTLPREVGWALAIAVRSEQTPRELEIVIDHPTHGPVPVILSTAVLHTDRREVSGALAVATDLSTVKALERNQRRMEHLSMMARFYAGIAHEIRSPLASISNFIAMLPDRFDDPEYRDTAVRLLPSEVARIVALADRLRSMAPTDGGRLTRVKLQPLLTDLVALHSASAIERGVTIGLRVDAALPDVFGDANQLVQLFVNLLHNAIEAMPTGGTVTIEARRDPEARHADLLIVDITDEGMGIDPGVHANVFDPFFTTKPSGTGLGLTICREIAEFHGATLRLFPWGNGRGTRARLTFVCAPPDAEFGRQELSRAATQT